MSWSLTHVFLFRSFATRMLFQQGDGLRRIAVDAHCQGDNHGP